ncbi:MAG: hypothetical protein ACK4TS_07405 [Aquabacterium sp.]
MGLSHAWLDELDVVGPRWRTSVWGWALLVLGMAMALHAWQHQQQANMDLQTAEDEVARLMRAQQRLAAAEASPPVAAGSGVLADAQAAAPALDDAGWRRAAQLAAWWSVDWSAQLDHSALVAAEQRIILTQWSLDLEAWSPVAGVSDASRPMVRLQGWSRDDESPLVWLSTLGPQAELQSRERLSETVDTRWGTLVWRVQAQAPMRAEGGS